MAMVNTRRLRPTATCLRCLNLVAAGTNRGIISAQKLIFADFTILAIVPRLERARGPKRRFKLREFRQTVLENYSDFKRCVRRQSVDAELERFNLDEHPYHAGKFTSDEIVPTPT